MYISKGSVICFNLVCIVGQLFGNTITYRPSTLNSCIDISMFNTTSLVSCVSACAESPECDGIAADADGDTFFGCSVIGVPEQTYDVGSSFYREMDETCFTSDIVAEVEDNQITASSVYDSELTPDRGRLNTLSTGLSSGLGAWIPASRDNNDYIQVMFDDIKEVLEIGTQGRNGHALQCVTEYQVSYSIDCDIFSIVKGTDDVVMTFPGNEDQDSVVWNVLPESLLAVCVRINPVAYRDFPAMRFGVKGCSSFQPLNSALP